MSSDERGGYHDVDGQTVRLQYEGMWNCFSRTPRMCLFTLRNSDDVATNGTFFFLPASAADFRVASEFRGEFRFASDCTPSNQGRTRKIQKGIDEPRNGTLDGSSV